MKRYTYKAIATDGHVVTGLLSADTVPAAMAQLRGDGLRVISLRGGGAFASAFRMKPRKLSLLAREWGALLEAGIPMTDALRLLASHRPRREAAALSRVAGSIESGMPLREALAACGAFPPFFLALAAVGEMSGTLPGELLRLSLYYEKEADVRRRLIAAAAYPFFLCLFVLALFIAILTIILPSFSVLFAMLAVPLPPATATALAWGQWISAHGLHLVLEIAAVAALLSFASRTPSGRRLQDRLLFHSHFVRRLFLIRLAHTLASLMESGVPLSEALGEAAPLSGNQEGMRRIHAVRAELDRGGHFPDALSHAGLTTPLLYSMTAAGMESGQLPDFLQNAARLMTEETERKLDTLKSLLGPLLLLIAGTLVAAVFFIIMVPIFTAIGSGL